jgi:phosphoglycolate phosphatase-like HAD superfamily hydrolase
VDGNRGEAGETKLRHLRRHLHDLEETRGPLNRCRVVVIGDALDDAGAARETGVWCVLYDGGSHHRAELAGVGMPIANTMLEALEIASRLVAEA